MVGRIAAKAAAGGARPLKPKPILHDADASVTHVEVCGCHGVGRLVEMLLDGEPIILSVRFSNPGPRPALDVTVRNFAGDSASARATGRRRSIRTGR